jgi:hypothetical protein
MHTHAIPPELLELDFLCIHCCSCHAHFAYKPANVDVVLAINDKHTRPVNMPTKYTSYEWEGTLE